MFNIRYHIASLVGVFLALALGLMLGGLVVQQGTVERQQSALVDGLRKEFAQIREDNQSLTAENEALAGFSGQLTDAWAADRLDGQTILVVAAAGQEEDVRAVTRAIEGAGGAVAVATILEPGLAMETPDVQSALTSAGMEPAELESVTASLAAELGFALQERPLVRTLSEAGVLRVEGLSAGTAAAGLVDLAAFEGEADSAGIALALAYDRIGSAVAVSPGEDDSDMARVADASDLAAIDHLETPLGRFSLVALLTGSPKGYYGTGERASALFPQLPTP